MSILKKIKGASLDCPMDASGRWRIPYTPDNLDQMTYKMDTYQQHNQMQLQPEQDYLLM